MKYSLNFSKIDSRTKTVWLASLYWRLMFIDDFSLDALEERRELRSMAALIEESATLSLNRARKFLEVMQETIDCARDFFEKLSGEYLLFGPNKKELYLRAAYEIEKLRVRTDKKYFLADFKKYISETKPALLPSLDSLISIEYIKGKIVILTKNDASGKRLHSKDVIAQFKAALNTDKVSVKFKG